MSNEVPAIVTFGLRDGVERIEVDDETFQSTDLGSYEGAAIPRIGERVYLASVGNYPFRVADVIHHPPTSDGMFPTTSEVFVLVKPATEEIREVIDG